MASTPPGNPNLYGGSPIQPPLAPKAGLGPLAWILIIVGGLFAILAVVLIAGGMFLVHKVKQAGLDPDLMRKNPVLATSKILATANPNAEVISIDERRGILHVRDKQTGKTFTMNFADVKQGKMVFQEDGQDAVSITANADGHQGNVVVQTNGKEVMTVAATGDDKTGSVEIRTKDGTGTFGAGAAKAPSWMPVYPGSQPEGIVGSNTADGTTGSFHFQTKDPVEKVIAFYKQQLKASGLKVSSTTMNETGGTISGGLQAEDAVNKRTVLIGYNNDNGDTSVTAAFNEKK